MKGRMVATWKMAYVGVKEAVEKLDQESVCIHEAILHAVKQVEDNPDFVSVGYGGLPNFDGVVELDAAYMDGDTLGFGGVMAVQNLKNPIEVAYDLSKYRRNCLLSGQGAVQYAKDKGYTLCNMLTQKADRRYQTDKKAGIDTEFLEAYGGHDTVCVIGKDRGTMACGVSTSGLFLKRPGRVGDSPVIGSGFYADSEIGSAAATGVGEDIMKGCLSFAIVERMKSGMDVQKACETALGDHLERFGRSGHKAGSISVIAMNKNNQIGAFTNKAVFPFVVGGMDSECRIYAVIRNREKAEIIEADERWLAEYKGD